jgi:hypothetical protein
VQYNSAMSASELDCRAAWSASAGEEGERLYSCEIRDACMNWKPILVSLAITSGALLVHGYHPNSEDAAIYLPGVKKALHPELFPYNQQFFAAHAHLTAFPQIIAWSVKITHLSLYPTLLLWHFTSIFVLLLACWKLSEHCTNSIAGRWTAVGLVAALLTLPVAGTALYIMDQYVNPRNLSAFVGVLAIALVLESKYALAGMVLMLGFAIHPFMTFFALVYCFLLVLMRSSDVRTVSMASFLPLSFLYPASSPAYHEVALSHPYHYLLRWHWYEWLGALGPLILFGWFSRLARSRGRRDLEAMCRTSLLLGALSIAAAFALSAPERFETLARIQPLRSFYVLYLLLLIFSGALAGEYLLKTQIWRWLILFGPMCTGMFMAQRGLFPESAHIEWPGAKSRNDWVQAFEWTRNNTPLTALFALDPYHMRILGEDVNGFRAIAERSMLADAVKDSGAVSMFPALADEWLRQVNAQRGWKDFRADDYRRLRNDFGVNWVVVQQPEMPGLDCPYRNRSVAVCRLDYRDSLATQLHP